MRLGGGGAIEEPRDMTVEVTDPLLQSGDVADVAVARSEDGVEKKVVLYSWTPFR